MKLLIYQTDSESINGLTGYRAYIAHQKEPIYDII